MTEKQENNKVTELFGEQSEIPSGYGLLEGLMSNGEATPLDILTMILTVPDEAFDTISQEMLVRLTSELDDPDNVYNIYREMQVSGLKPGDLLDELGRAIVGLEDDEIDDELLTPKKKDFMKHFISVFYNKLSHTMAHQMEKVMVGIQRLNDDVKKPAYAHVGDAGLDIYATEEIEIKPGETKLLKTGFKVDIPSGYELQVRNKSGVALKTKLRLANAVGTIDSNYKEEVGVIIENIEPQIAKLTLDHNDNGEVIITDYEYGKSYFIEKGQKIAQLVLNAVPVVIWQEKDEINRIDNNRTGGYGSTGNF